MGKHAKTLRLIEAAQALGGRRNQRGGDFSQSMPDVEHPLFSIEVKHRKKLPYLLRTGLEQAKKYNGKKPPLLILKERGQRGALVVLRLEDFVDPLGPLQRGGIFANEEGENTDSQVKETVMLRASWKKKYQELRARAIYTLEARGVSPEQIATSLCVPLKTVEHALKSGLLRAIYGRQTEQNEHQGVEAS